MEFLIYAFSGAGLVATIWFAATAAAKAWPGNAKGGLESRIAELERRMPR